MRNEKDDKMRNDKGERRNEKGRKGEERWEMGERKGKRKDFPPGMTIARSLSYCC